MKVQPTSRVNYPLLPSAGFGRFDASRGVAPAATMAAPATPKAPLSGPTTAEDAYVSGLLIAINGVDLRAKLRIADRFIYGPMTRKG